MLEVPSELLGGLRGEIAEGLPVFCLERWQSLHETTARVNLSESGVYPLTLRELEEYGVDLKSLSDLELEYGWTRGSPELRRAISRLYGGAINLDAVVVTAGSAEANLLSVLAVVRRGDTVVVDMPNYMQIPGLLKWVGAKVVYLWRKPPYWRFPLQEALDLISRLRPKAVFVTDPNNPTGSYMSPRELEDLALEASRRGSMLIFDEVYWGTERGEPKLSVAQVAPSKDYISVSGLSKVYGLPGLRIGWLAAGSRRLAELAWSIKDYISIAPPVVSDRIASLVLESSTVRKLRERARRIVEENVGVLLAETSGSRVLEPQPGEAGAFALARIPWSSETLTLAYAIYRRRGVLVAPGECFELGGYLRVGLGARSDIFKEHLRELLEALTEVKKAEGLRG